MMNLYIFWYVMTSAFLDPFGLATKPTESLKEPNV